MSKILLLISALLLCASLFSTEALAAAAEKLERVEELLGRTARNSDDIAGTAAPKYTMRRTVSIPPLGSRTKNADHSIKRVPLRDEPAMNLPTPSIPSNNLKQTFTKADLRFSMRADDHLVYREYSKSSKGISGAHNWEHFRRHSNSYEIDNVVAHPQIPGIARVEYRMYAKDNSGQITNRLRSGEPPQKTVYDPLQNSDEMMQAWSREAWSNATLDYSLKSGRKIYSGVADNGLSYKFYVRQNGIVENYHPFF